MIVETVTTFSSTSGTKSESTARLTLRIPESSLGNCQELNADVAPHIQSRACLVLSDLLADVTDIEAHITEKTAAHCRTFQSSWGPRLSQSSVYMTCCVANVCGPNVGEVSVYAYSAREAP